MEPIIPSEDEKKITPNIDVELINTDRIWTSCCFKADKDFLKCFKKELF